MELKDSALQAGRLLDRWLDFVAWVNCVPSLSVGVAVGADVVFAKSYGFEDLTTRKPATPATLYRIASHSKLFTATAIMKLYEAGRLRLDDPVRQHLPWFASDADPNMAFVTLRELLSHSSGMNRDGHTGHWMNDEFPDAEAIRAQAAAGLSVFGGLEHWKYSNMGFTVLGQVVEAVTGQSYAKAVTKLVLEPMGLSETAPDYDDASVERHATGYGINYPDRERETFTHVHAHAMNSATGFSSNVRDMLRFYSFHVPGNESYLSDRTKREMQRPQFQDGPYTWGLGFAVDRSGRQPTVGHGGAYPGYMTASALNPASGLVIVVMTSAMDGAPQLFLKGIESLINYAADNAADLTATEADDTGLYDQVAGFYGSRWGALAAERLGGKLVTIGTDPSVMPGDAVSRLDYLGDSGFRYAVGPKNGMFGETMQFVPDDGAWRIESGMGAQRTFSFKR